MNSKYYIKYEYGGPNEPDDGSIIVYNQASGSYFSTKTLNYLEVDFLYPKTDLISVLGNTNKRFKDIFGNKLALYSSGSVEPEINLIPISGSEYSWVIKPFSSSSTVCLGFYFNGSLKTYITPDGNMMFFVN
jgi:hypothetical protein